MTVSLYIYVDEVAKRIELFEDENINISSSVQDIKDISKAKTDFSQSFTIPASSTNNEIFKHWYESAIDNSFDQRIKYKGFIEIDGIPFRKGGFCLNNASIKNNRVENYNITFYGDAKNITDLIKEDKLNSLDFSGLNHTFTPTEVINRINGTTTDNVKYPLLAHDRLYDYNNASANDITTNTGSILWRSLFPAIPLPYVMQKIQDKYGITFTGAFLNYTQFSKLHLLMKNAETLNVPTLSQKVNFTSKDSNLNNTEVNLTTDEIGLRSIVTVNNFRSLRIQITPTSSINYSVEIRKNGQPYLFFTNLSGTSNNFFFQTGINTQNVNDKFTIYVSSDSPMTYTSTLYYQRGITSPPTIYTATGTSQTTQSIIDIVRYAPDIKIMDFLSGLIKMFNLIIIPTNDTTFELLPLELYYNNGIIKDISANVIADDIDIKKTSTYKNINFNFESSENILNTKFRELFTAQRGYDYGDLKYEQIDSLESATFEIKLPFENPMFERKTGSSFQTITFKNKDLNNYVPKPVLMYLNGQQDVSAFPIKINTESGYTSINTYARFSNEYYNGTIMPINWGAEISTWYLNTVSNGLYQRHYSNYIGNIFSLKGRLLNVKCKFNPVELSEIKLNDRVVIRDKKYTINTMKSNLITGEVDFELLTDYRTIGSVQIGARYSFEDNYVVDKTAQDLEIMVLTNGATQVKPLTPTEAWLSYGTLTQYDNNFVIVVSIASNGTLAERQGNLVLEYDYNGTIENILIPITQDA